MSTIITVMPAYRAGAGLIGVSFGVPPIECIECSSDLATIAAHVQTIKETHAARPFKILFRHTRKPRGWDKSDIKWQTDNLPELVTA